MNYYIVYADAFIEGCGESEEAAIANALEDTGYSLEEYIEATGNEPAVAECTRRLYLALSANEDIHAWCENEEGLSDLCDDRFTEPHERPVESASGMYAFGAEDYCNA